MIPVHTDRPVVEPGTIVAIAWAAFLAVVAITGIFLVIWL